ncbi:MAG: hypothetical protein SGCHY_005274, partial [Lobulomycetales sp.]
MSINLGTSDYKAEASVPNSKITGVQETLLQESEKDIIWYRDNFCGKSHSNFLATDSPRGPIAISLIQDEDCFKALIRVTQGSERLSISTSAIPCSLWRRSFGMGPSTKDIFAALSRNIPTKNLTLCKDSNLPNDLLAMEERQVIRSYKFGVGYLKKGQSTEEHMLSNKYEDSSPEFKQFLAFLGETIELKGWKGYRAGLDVSGINNTGVNSVYTKWQGYEIMYHVSSMLPYNEKDTQHLERKRHIGNDIVVIVFQDDYTVPFQVSSLTSHQNHVLVVVTPHVDGYRMSIASKTGVPTFTPELPDPVIFPKEAVGRDFFLHKLVNGERASYKAPSFAGKISRTRTVLL